MKNKWFTLGIILICVILLTLGGLFVIHLSNTVSDENSFSLRFFKMVDSHSEDDNFVVSPYSVEMALSMLRDGAKENTLEQIQNVVSKKDYVFPDSIKIANGLFVKEQFQSSVNQDYYDHLVEDYQAEILYDEFRTPDVINDWVSQKTNHMIPHFMDHISSQFVLGIVNAVAMDSKWSYPFDCTNTNQKDFIDGSSKYSVEMMQKLFDSETDVSYLNHDVKGILLPYEDDLEFIALLPEGDIHSFIEKLNDKKLNQYLDQFQTIDDSTEVHVELPRFDYDYDLSSFKEILNEMGIVDVFHSKNANLQGIISLEEMAKLEIDNIYVSSAIHKAKITLTEEDTKAAAATGFMMDYETSAEIEVNLINIHFDKPFMYLIRDSKTKDIYFMGVVHQPNLWDGSTC